MSSRLSVAAISRPRSLRSFQTGTSCSRNPLSNASTWSSRTFRTTVTVSIDSALGLPRRRLDVEGAGVRPDASLMTVIPADPVFGPGLVLDDLEDLAPTHRHPDLVRLHHDAIAHICRHAVSSVLGPFEFEPLLSPVRPSRGSPGG